MTEIIDIHSHILPGVDDGAKDMDMTMEMIRIYKRNGVNKIIVTPHYVKNSSMSTSLEDIKKVLEEVRQEIERAALDFEIYLGHEIYLCRDLLDKLETGKVGTMNGTSYVFVELPQMDIPDYTRGLIRELVDAGYRPILSHPEKNTLIIEDINIVYDFIQDGALIEVDIPSVCGNFGRDVKRASQKLLKHKMVHFLATGAHSSIRRTPRIDSGIGEIEELIGEELFKRLTYDNPKKVIEGEIIEIEKAKSYKKSKFFNLFSR